MQTTWLEDLKNIAGAIVIQQHEKSIWIDAPDVDVLALAQEMKIKNARLATMTGIAVPNNETQVVYHYTWQGYSINIKATSKKQQLPSITPITLSANWAEIEIQNYYGTNFQGHPPFTLTEKSNPLKSRTITNKNQLKENHRQEKF